MERIVQALNEEWAKVIDSPRARRALMRWKARYAHLATVRTVDDFVDTRGCRQWGAEALRALAAESASDEMAARTLLQAVMPGLIRTARLIAPFDREVVGELVGIAWAYIRAYPVHRPGHVAANVLLDVRKEYFRGLIDRKDPERKHKIISDPNIEMIDPRQPIEDVACDRVLIDELVAACDRGLVTRAGLETIIRTRVGGESLAEMAATQNESADALWRRRSRAERRLRTLPLAA